MKQLDSSQGEFRIQNDACGILRYCQESKCKSTVSKEHAASEEDNGCQHPLSQDIKATA